MMEKSGRERALILVKALPHVGRDSGETVCCAGITIDRQWRRQYPIHFRRLKDQKFSRWQWIEYDWVAPQHRKDLRKESRRVQEDSIVLHDLMPQRERANFLAPLIVQSTDHAKDRGDSLALIRPIKSQFSWREKTQSQIDKERAAYKDAANQQSFFDDELAELKPCPFSFHFEYTTEDGKSHSATCDDWETSATFYKWEAEYGRNEALQRLGHIFNVEYPQRGMVFAMGTHSRRPDQWLLVGVIRLDKSLQASLL